MDQIRSYIEAIFSELPRTKEIVDMRLTMLENMTEKYEELLADGVGENEAIGTVIRSIGSAEDLKKELELMEPTELEEKEAELVDTKNRGFGIAFSIFLYISSPIVYLIWQNISETMAIIGCLFIVALATANLIYWGVRGSKAKKAQHEDEFREDGQKSPKQKKSEALQSIIWTTATLIYLVLGFLFNLWHPGWLIFLVATGINSYLHYLAGEEEA
ncbi:permease prefix domain 1-containing protein [Carnobacterium maltaromaticum]|uniref:permease prefix domain 1-containing protein n=1 Tax=Carnobacterium maltaromaticum TaxID=2751 RepID=UPI0005592F5B|nr:permease prefix domain 1-containing protein [Carnobacterium maltaromaticum]